MKNTLSEAQVRGLISVCEDAHADAVRFEPVEQKREAGPFVPIEGTESLKVVTLRVDAYGIPGGWTESPYWVRPSGRWCPPGNDNWQEPAEAT